ncbi:MAG: hypothetical protein QOH21_2981 [Acidobacteriota bacterium]|nr:hypothetical protein [Acidobacteriota bacterium]
MNASKTCLLALLLLLAALPAAAQVNDTYVIPASANAAGGNNTNWLTQFSIFNPHFDHKLVVSVTFMPSGGRTGIEELVEVPANSIAFSDNILADLFDVQQDTGSLLVATFKEDNPGVPDTIIARSFLVTSNTYNDDPSGTYGQTIPGTFTGLLDIDSDGISAIAHGIRNDTRPDGFRTNVGALNLGRCNATLRVSVFDADGKTLLDRAAMTLPPLGHLQQRLPVSVERGSVEFYVEDPCAADDDLYAVVFPYTSTVDALSGDPTYQSPTLLAGPGDLLTSMSKKALTIDPTALGKKLTSAYARNVRAQAEHRGTAKLVKAASGWKITK